MLIPQLVGGFDVDKNSHLTYSIGTSSSLVLNVLHTETVLFNKA